MTDLKSKYEQQNKISWPRVTANSAAIAVHVLIFMMLMAPVSAPDSKKGEETVTMVSFSEPPPPPPPPPPEPPKELKKQIIQTAPAKNIPPPPEETITYDTPGPMDTAAPPPSPPAPPASPPADFGGGDVDASTRAQFPVKYPPAALRAGVTGTVIVQVTYDANGTVTDASVYKSSRNRDLDRAAVAGVRKWKINPGKKNGQNVGGSALVTVDFTL